MEPCFSSNSRKRSSSDGSSADLSPATSFSETSHLCVSPTALSKSARTTIQQSPRGGPSPKPCDGIPLVQADLSGLADQWEEMLARVSLSSPTKDEDRLGVSAQHHDVPSESQYKDDNSRTRSQVSLFNAGSEPACLGSSHRTTDVALEESLPACLGLSHRSNWDGASSGRLDTANLGYLPGGAHDWGEPAMQHFQEVNEDLEVVHMESEGRHHPGEGVSDLTNNVELQETPSLEASELRAVVEGMQSESWALNSHELSIIVRISRGSTGSIYKGMLKDQGVAVKIISLATHNTTVGADNPPLAPWEEDDVSVSNCHSSPRQQLQCFQREVDMLSRVRHPNILSLVGACAAWPRLFIVTELMPRGSVRDALDYERGGMPLGRALRVLRDAARGMEFLHSQGVIHRDLKAANLLIDQNEDVKVCDFGTARILPPPVNGPEEGDDSRFTQYSPQNPRAQITGETGTYRWMAPEVLENKAYGFKADVFSFGITMWEVFTGGVPYQGMTPIQAALGVIQTSLRPQIPSRVPHKLATLIQMCWSTEPALRPSFSKVVLSLEELAASHLKEPAVSVPLILGSWKAKSGLGKLWRKTFGKRKNS